MLELNVYIQIYFEEHLSNVIALLFSYINLN